MRKVTAWFTLGTFLLLGSSVAVGCGSDEATNDDDDDGGTILDGGMDSGRDSGSSQLGESLGEGCINDAQCGGLTCITEDQLLLGGGAPPKGLCTMECDTDDACLEIAEDSFCVSGYCIQGCAPGATLEPKCQGREEFVCTVIDLIPSNSACDVLDDCDEGELCSSGVCQAMVYACLPNCGGDHDCADGLFCDFASGLCVEDEPTGIPINEECDPDLANDPCQGICLPASAGSDEGSCSAFCNLGSATGCGFDGSGQADAACLFATIFAPDPAAGDVGLCGQLCDCNDDCLTPGDLCAPLGIPELEEFWQRAGYCRPLSDDPSDDFTGTELDCGAGGSGNTGEGGAGGGPG